MIKAILWFTASLIILAYSIGSSPDPWKSVAVMFTSLVGVVAFNTLLDEVREARQKAEKATEMLARMEDRLAAIERFSRYSAERIRTWE